MKSSKNQFRIGTAVLLVCLLNTCLAQAIEKDISIYGDQPGAKISPVLYGLFFEDINYAGDGGLYAELVQNRSFEYFPIEHRDFLREKTSAEMNSLYAWEKIERGGGKCRLEVTRWTPLNRNNENYLTLYIDNPGEGVGVANLGFDGIRVDKEETYDVSFYALLRDSKSHEPVTLALEGENGRVYGCLNIETPDASWKKYSGSIKANQSDDHARLTITTKATGKLLLDMVSLFPQKTFKGRANGLRPDLAQALVDLHPKFLRFPGGCITHGYGLANAYRWKDSVGDVASRRPNHTTWGYHQTLGLGYYEYFLLCEDLGAKPLPVIPVGVSCGFNFYEFAKMDELGDWVQDALDLIEFANGPKESKWGSIRAKMGHPASFGLEYICLGNEEHDTSQFRERFPLFVEAVRKAHPEIKIIGTSGLGANVPLYQLMEELGVYSSDEHYYCDPEWFLRNQNRFDEMDRNGPKVFVGEYASKGNTLYNAVAEAAYLTGVERNSDWVEMAAYAPLFAKADHTQWKAANMIYFDNRNIVKTPNYYVQQMFSCNQGDVYLKSKISESNPKAGGQGESQIAVSASRDTASNELILKLVNPCQDAVEAKVHLEGLSKIHPSAKVTILKGNASAKNTFEEPNQIAPATQEIHADKEFGYRIPAMSVQVIRIKGEFNL